MSPRERSCNPATGKHRRPRFAPIVTASSEQPHASTVAADHSPPVPAELDLVKPVGAARRLAGPEPAKGSGRTEHARRKEQCAAAVRKTELPSGALPPIRGLDRFPLFSNVHRAPIILAAARNKVPAVYTLSEAARDSRSAGIASAASGNGARHRGRVCRHGGWASGGYADATTWLGRQRSSGQRKAP